VRYGGGPQDTGAGRYDDGRGLERRGDAGGVLGGGALIEQLDPVEVDDTPAIMADYKPIDMQQLLWCYQYPNGKFACREANGIPKHIISSTDVNQVRFEGEWIGSVPRFSGQYVQYTLAQLLGGDGDATGVGVYVRYPYQYRLVGK